MINMRDRKAFFTEVGERKYFTAGQEGTKYFKLGGFFWLGDERAGPDMR